MSFAGSRQCTCPRYTFYQASQKHQARELVVVQRRQNRSSYNGCDYIDSTWEYSRLVKQSNWSHVLCLTCGWHWRTQAKYPDRLPDLSEEGQQLCYRELKNGKPAGLLLLAKIRDSYNRPLFFSNLPAKSSPSRSTRARNLPAKRAIAGKGGRR